MKLRVLLHSGMPQRKEIYIFPTLFVRTFATLHPAATFSYFAGVRLFPEYTEIGTRRMLLPLLHAGICGRDMGPVPPVGRIFAIIRQNLPDH